MKSYFTIISYLLIISLTFNACKKDDIITNKQTIINFSHTVNGLDLPTCCVNNDTLSYINLTGEKFSVETLKYIISNITLHEENGESNMLKDIHFVDLDDRESLRIDINEMNNKNYTSISFVMGLNSEMNTENNYVNELFHTAMWWPGQANNPPAYHYMKLEGSVDTIAQGYKVHTGPTMGMNYSFNNNFIISLDITNKTSIITININMEINNWFQTPNIISLPKSAEGGMMMDMQKQEQIQENGKEDVFSVSVSTR